MMITEYVVRRADRDDGVADMHRLADLVLLWRRHLGWTQAELNTKANLGDGTISRIERRQAIPGWDKVVKIIHAVGCEDDPGRFFQPPWLVNEQDKTESRREVLIVRAYERIPVTRRQCQDVGHINLLPEHCPIPAERAVAVKVDEGNALAMRGTVHLDEWLICDSDAPRVRLGALIVCTFNKQGLVRFHGQRDGQTVLRASNPYVPEIVVGPDDKFRILGPVLLGISDKREVSG